jgi:hypothetical protein
MTPVEAAQYLERTRKTLAQWRYNKKGPAFIKVGERIYYDKTGLGWMASNQISGLLAVIGHNRSDLWTESSQIKRLDNRARIK